MQQQSNCWVFFSSHGKKKNPYFGKKTLSNIIQKDQTRSVHSCLLYQVRSSAMAIQTSWSVPKLCYGQELQGTCCSEPQDSFRSLSGRSKEVAFPVFCDELVL